MSVRRHRPLLLLALIGALGLAAIAGCGSSEEPPPALSSEEVHAALEAPAEGQSAVDRKLDSRAGTLLPAGDARDAKEHLSDRIRSLRGTPVVVNVWAEWCEPCKRELPLLQRFAIDRRGEVAVLGVASDRRAKAEQLLGEIAMPYPSILDEEGSISNSVGVKSIPKTLFYDAQGKRTFVKLGEYKSVSSLEDDVERYTGVPARE